MSQQQPQTARLGIAQLPRRQQRVPRGRGDRHSAGLRRWRVSRRAGLRCLVALSRTAEYLDQYLSFRRNWWNNEAGYSWSDSTLLPQPSGRLPVYQCPSDARSDQFPALRDYFAVIGGKSTIVSNYWGTGSSMACSPSTSGERSPTSATVRRTRSPSGRASTRHVGRLGARLRHRRPGRAGLLGDGWRVFAGRQLFPRQSRHRSRLPQHDGRHQYQPPADAANR